ncbi:unnamed protein product [Urochloa decumbens]|uniref:Sulfotransferase n=1 Tax=Urochloa decumbens TaxID=240449 RepID=A0ABC9D3H1_9POAL
MSSSQTFPWQTKGQEADAEAETNPELYQRFADLVSSFPTSEAMLDQLYRHDDQGWHAPKVNMVGAMVADSCFAARPSDIIVASLPKSGTTWIKALVFATVHRDEYRPADADDHPFHSVSPHECISFLEFRLYSGNRIPNLDKLPDPRLFATHVPFMALPRTIRTTSCKIVYVCRDPKDTLVSTWYFLNKFRARAGMDPLTVERAAELFCDGLSPFGPYWDHVLGYWRAHLAHPEKVLFFRYEEMQRDPAAHVRRLAEFVGLPFDVGEEEDGVVAAIVRMCSFEHMSGLKATKHGSMMTKDGPIANSLFYRRGVVGDWVNHLSPEVARRIDAITQARFMGSGLNV